MNKKLLVLGISTAVLLSSCTTTLTKKTTEETVDYSKQIQAARESLMVSTPAVREDNAPLVMVHYMPWFSAPPVSDGYGFHWHQGGGVFDPYETDASGKAQIATHYYPLTGPYDSADTDVLEYQAALMKLSGIDGVIFDWYGIEDALDYKSIHNATLKMVEVCKKAGLKFCICYEDQSIGKMIEADKITKADALQAGKNVFSWLEANWFKEDLYLKLEDRPVVLCFGPQYFKDKAQWDSIFTETTNPRPYFIGLDDHCEGWTEGSYCWPPMWASTNGKLSFARLVKYINEYYETQNAKPHLVTTAFPGFHDIYREAGNGASYGYLEYADGETFKLTVDAALMANPDVIQIATWNDFGEGTIIEPTIEHGYKELEYLQDVEYKYNQNFTFNYGDLRTPIEIYRKIVKGTDDEKAKAREAFTALLQNNLSAYRSLIKELGIKSSLDVKPILRETTGTTNASQSGAVYDANGKRNLALGTPVVASSHIYDYTGKNAVDGDALTYWEGAANKYPNVVTVDVVTKQNLEVAVLKLNPKRIWSKRVQTIAVDVSENGTDFTNLIPEAEYTFDPNTNENTVVIPLNVSASAVRFTITGNTQANAGQLAEIEIY